MIRKAALMGCRKGTWVSVVGLRDTSLRVGASPQTRIRVHVDSAPDARLYIIKPGTFPFDFNALGAKFIQLEVEDGEHENVLVTLIGELADAVHAAS